MNSKIGGKWLVYTGFSLEKQDSIWNSLLPLCNEGILSGLKSSTAIISEAQKYMDGEAILCYTANANDIDNVKKAGDEIRKTLKMYDEVSKYLSFYKTNVSSRTGRYSRHGYFGVTSYMHTVKGTFYSRDRHERWILTKL